MIKLGNLVMLVICFSGCGTIRNCEIRMKPGGEIKNVQLTDVIVFREPGVRGGIERSPMKWSDKKFEDAQAQPSTEEINMWLDRLFKMGILKQYTPPPEPEIKKGKKK